MRKAKTKRHSTTLVNGWTTKGLAGFHFVAVIKEYLLVADGGIAVWPAARASTKTRRECRKQSTNADDHHQLSRSSGALTVWVRG